MGIVRLRCNRSFLAALHLIAHCHCPLLIACFPSSTSPHWVHLWGTFPSGLIRSPQSAVLHGTRRVEGRGSRLGLPPCPRYAVGMLVDVRSQTREELALQFQSWALPAYRLEQVLEWLYA